MLRTYVVYFLINLVSAEMGEETVKTVILESVLKKRKREEEWALAKKQDLEATKKKINAENRKLDFNRAKQYSKEYEQRYALVICNYI